MPDFSFIIFVLFLAYFLLSKKLSIHFFKNISQILNLILKKEVFFFLTRSCPRQFLSFVLPNYIYTRM